MKYYYADDTILYQYAAVITILYQVKNHILSCRVILQVGGLHKCMYTLASIYLLTVFGSTPSP